MRMPLSCTVCSSERPDEQITLYSAAVTDSGLYEFTCKNGHESKIILQQCTFEVLSEVGLQALIDGYYRDAVVSLSSSMERFFQFFVEVISEQQEVSPEALSKTWSTMASQSERQLGAYLISHLLAFGEHAPVLGAKQAAFRNKVVHQGKIPTEDEAVGYCQSVVDLVRPTIKKLQDKAERAISSATHRHMMKVRSHLRGDQQTSTLCFPTVLSLSQGGDQLSVRGCMEARRNMYDRRWYR